MNKKTKIIIDELKKAGLITKEEDLTAGDKTNLIFDYMIKHYSYLLDTETDKVLSKENFEKGKIIHEIILKFGKYFLKNPQIIENREKLLNGDNETFSNVDKSNFSEDAKLPEGPVIFVTNHGFKDDILATILAAKRRAFIVFGSLPQFYGTIDGILSAKNGVIMVNRKVDKSKSSSIEKGKYALANGTSLMICPEGVWNKKPNGGMLDFWSGFYRIAQKEDGTFYPIIPIVHYISNTHKPGKENPIHTIVDDPIILDGMSQKEGVEYVRTRMLSWYWKLIEKYGKTTRKELLDGYDSSTEAWEDELTERVKTADKYDLEIEISADKVKKDDLLKEQLEVWETIANLKITKENAKEVVEAKKLVKELKRNDFQHRF